MAPRDQHRLLTRRALFGRGAAGLGTLALSTLLGDRAAGAAPSATPTHPHTHTPTQPHFPPTAKRVIYLLQNGAPSHVDLFDYKPKLRELMGQEIPPSVQGGQRLSTMTSGQKSKPLLPNITEFASTGRAAPGSPASFPIRPRWRTTSASSAPSTPTRSTTRRRLPSSSPARSFRDAPSMGAWLSYGLGSETEELPAFVVMTSRDKEASCGQIFYDFYWGSGFLPTRFQGVKFRGSGDPVLYLSDPPGMSRQVRRELLDDLAALNRMKQGVVGDPEIDTRISQYEMAYRMQASVPELTDLSKEPQHVLEMYGPDVRRPGSYAYNCLLARRLAERGVRFVQLMHAGWDQHKNLNSQLKIQCEDTDQPSAALVNDLKQRGLLDDTLVIWGGEFGRTPFLQGAIEDRANWGRDHHPRCFTLWMAGGGIRPGVTYGETDDFGYNVAKDPVSVHDFQATLLHCLGIEHTKLTFRFQGRDYRLTDVHGSVVTPLLA